MSQLAQRLGFDLANSLPGNCERLPDLFQRVLAAVFQPEAHLDDFLFAWRQRAQDLSSLVLQVHVDHRLCGRNHAAVFDEVAQMRIFLFANRRFEPAPPVVRLGAQFAVSEIAAELRHAGYSEKEGDSPLGSYRPHGGSIEVLPGPESYHSPEPATITVVGERK